MGRKRVGRPGLKPSERRGEIFRFMATKRESAKLRAKAKAAGLTISEYLRSVAL